MASERAYLAFVGYLLCYGSLHVIGIHPLSSPIGVLLAEHLPCLLGTLSRIWYVPVPGTSASHRITHFGLSSSAGSVGTYLASQSSHLNNASFYYLPASLSSFAMFYKTDDNGNAMLQSFLSKLFRK